MLKGLSFRLKGQPIASTVATLVGRDLFTFAEKWPWQWELTPISPMYGGFAALRAVASGSWTSPGMQQPDGKRLILVAMTPRQRHRGHRGRAAARPSAKELLLRPKIFKSWLGGIQRSGNSRSSAAGRVGGAWRARTQDVSGWPLSTCTGDAFGTCPPLRIVHICRVVFPGPECVPDRPVAGDVHVGSQF